MTPDELARDLERRAGEAEAIHATAPVADVFRTLIRELKQIKTHAPLSKKQPERLLSVSELASRMSVGERYIYDHSAEWSFTVRIGRKLRFSERGFEVWLRQAK